MKTKSIPTILAVLILILVLGVLSFGKDQVTSLFSKASVGSAQVANLEISNLSESGWTVSWTTSEKTTGAVFYGKNELASDGVAADDRDQEPLSGSYYSHYVTIADMTPGAYFFRIGVNQDKIGREGLSPYAVLLPNPLAGGVKSDPIYGKVKSGGTAATHAVVIFTAAGSQSISALTNNQGDFVLPLTTLRTVDLKKVLPLTDGISEQLKIIGSDLAVSVVTCTAGYDRPVPTITLGQNSNCGQASGTGSIPVAQQQSNNLPTSSGLMSPSLNLLEGETLDQLPTFSGKAGPSQKVEIEVHSETPVNAAAVAGTDGKWSWTPPKTLAPGEHTVTITAKNPDGTADVITRKFIVFADTSLLPVTSGEKFSTVSAALPITTPTPTPPPPPPPPAPKMATKSATPVKTLPQTGMGESVGILVFSGGLFLLVAFLARRAGNLV